MQITKKTALTPISFCFMIVQYFYRSMHFLLALLNAVLFRDLAVIALYGKPIILAVLSLPRLYHVKREVRGELKL